MKKQGREPTPLTSEERKLVEEFIQNSDSYEEFAQKVGLTKAQLRYRVSKYRKEQLEDGWQETDN